VCGVDSIGSGVGPVAGCCECGDELSGSGTTELLKRALITIELHFYFKFAPETICILHFFSKTCILR
jgi:hypothetical protein